MAAGETFSRPAAPSCNGGIGRSRRLFRINLMKMRLAIILPLATMVLAEPARAGQATAGNIETPEHGRPGPYRVGTRYREISLGEREGLTADGVRLADRTIGVRFWYPAEGRNGAPVEYRHAMVLPGGARHNIVEKGAAVDGAAAAKGPFPVVILSHGFGGWSEHLSRLGEHLATRGYVIASIDHRDMAFDSVPGFLLSFGKVLNDRSLDQQQVTRLLADRRFVSNEPALSSADMTRLALIGYSMGGFGALGAAGAPYDPSSRAFASLPGPLRDRAGRVDAEAAGLVDSVVLIAPWGGQPDQRAWSPLGLTRLDKPTLLISGDRDDIVNFKEGIGWLFQSLTSADRYLLAYREAGHNVAGNAVQLGAQASAEEIGFALDPVWRQERLNQINQHFITVFLDWTLKGDPAARAYLDVPTPFSNDGRWDVPFGTLDDGTVAGDRQPQFWRGFPRRWAKGMELHHRAKGQ